MGGHCVVVVQSVIAKTMVKLPSPEEQPARAVGERGSHRPQAPRSHHLWGARYGRRREEMRRRLEPSSLLQLEELARRTVEVMEKHSAPSDEHFPMAMRLLREQYNLNFAMVCERCRGSHNYDELTAPER